MSRFVLSTTKTAKPNSSSVLTIDHRSIELTRYSSLEGVFEIIASTRERIINKTAAVIAHVDENKLKPHGGIPKGDE